MAPPLPSAHAVSAPRQLPAAQPLTLVPVSFSTRHVSLATASAFVNSVAKAHTEGKAMLANVSSPMALHWSTLQVQYVRRRPVLTGGQVHI